MLSLSSVNEVVAYCPDTGVFTPRQQGVRVAQTTAGYWSIRFNGIVAIAHRVAWLLVHGAMPDTSKVVDHIDGDPSNNRASNLRLVTKRQNGQNLTKHRAGARPGARWKGRDKCWYAVMKVSGRKVYLGQFKSRAEAEDCYASAVLEWTGSPCL